MKKQYLIAILPTIIFAILIFFFWCGLSLDPQHLPSARLNKMLPSFNLPDLENKNRVISSGELKGNPMLLHVFASWCSSCATEPVFLFNLAKEGIPLIGLNYKDEPEDAQNWLKLWGNPYALVLSDLDGRAGIDLGVYGTPETFLIDSQGIIRERYVGPLSDAVWQKDLKPKWEALI